MSQAFTNPITGEENKFLKVLFDPKEITKRAQFTIGVAAGRFISLIIFAVVGASISVGFQNLSDFLNPDYWVAFFIMTAEQFYAYDIGYKLGRSLRLNGLGEYKQINDKSDTMINGLVEDGKVLLEPLTKESVLIDEAIDEINKEEKQRLYILTIDENQRELETKITDLEAKKSPKVFKRMRMAKRNRKIAKFQRTIDVGKKLKENTSVILSIPDEKIPNFQPLSSSTIISNQEEELANAKQSRYHMRSLKKYESKGAVKRAANRFIMGAIGPLILWGALFSNGGAVVYTIFMMLMQAFGGWMFSGETVKKVDIWNATQRFAALKDVQSRIPKIKEQNRKAKELEEAKHLAALEALKTNPDPKPEPSDLDAKAEQIPQKNNIITEDQIEEITNPEPQEIPFNTAPAQLEFIK